jgi:hypothetical protein
MTMADLTRVGHAGLKGWRAKVGDVVAGPVASRSPLSEDQVRAAIGALFFALATVYVARTAATLVREARG